MTDQAPQNPQQEAQKQTSLDGLQKKMASAQARAEKYFDTDDDMPLSKHLLMFSVVGFCVLFILWASFATLDEVTRGQGRVVPSSEIQVLQSLEGGIVDEFMASEGQQVKKGQVLMRLRDIDASSNLGSNRVKYLGLLATITRLQAQVEDKDAPSFPDEVVEGVPQTVTEEMNAFLANKEQLRTQLQVLEQQLNQREQEVRELSSRISDTRSVIALMREEQQTIEPLVARGSAPKLELLQLERSMKEKQTELNGLLNSLPRTHSAANEIKARIDEVKKTAKAQAQVELSTKMVEMNAIKETLGALKDRKVRTEIRSPVDGTIKDFKINTVGGVVRAGEDIIEVVPADENLVVEAKIRPSDIAFLYPGQEAIVKITAYDFSIYGGLDAKVIDISADTIREEGPNGVENFYRVKLRTEENTLKRKGEVLPVIPGMVASVDILTGKKTVMEYLLKPFIKTLDLAMNER